MDIFNLQKNPAAIIPLTRLDDFEDKINFLLSAGGGTSALIGMVRSVDKLNDTVTERDTALQQIATDAPYTDAGRELVKAGREALKDAEGDNAVPEELDDLVELMKARISNARQTKPVDSVVIGGITIKVDLLRAFMLAFSARHELGHTSENKLKAEVSEITEADAISERLTANARFIATWSPANPA